MMKRYFHLQILVSMLCLAVAARRHQRVHAYVLPYQSSGDRPWHTRIHVRPIPAKRETTAWPAARQLSPTIEGPWKGISSVAPMEDSWRGIPSSSRSARYNLAPPLGPEPWNGGIAEPTKVQHARHETIPDVRYEESILEESRPLPLPHKGHLFSWNADDPSFYELKGSSESKLKPSKKQLSTPWKYFQQRPSFYTSPSSRENSSRQNEN